jgi:arabinofuranosyltransferase
MRGRIATYAPIAVVILIAVAHIYFLRFVCDDAFISYRYSRNLAHGAGLVFNVGERVEGYTNFLWVLIGALVIRLGAAPERVMPVLGAACSLLLLVAVTVILLRRGHRYGFAGLLLALNAGFAAWASGGLETGLFTLLIGASVLLVLSGLEDREGVARVEPAPLFWGAVALALAALTRPEGLLVMALVGLFLVAQVIRRRLPASRVLQWGLLAFGPVLLHLLWRRQYYGRFLPNTFAVKSSGAGHLEIGLEYLRLAGTHFHAELLLLPLLALPMALRRHLVSPRALVLCGMIVAPYLCYIAAVGGDFMDLFRFVVPILPLVALVAGAGLEALAAGGSSVRARLTGATLAWAVVILWGAANLHAAWDSTRVWSRGNLDSIGLLRSYTRDWTQVGRYLAAHTRPSDSLATTAAGIIPYYSDRYTIDQLGLSAPDLAQFHANTITRPGHALLASGEWINRLNPQFLLGQPIVVNRREEAQVSLQLDPGWDALILPRYHPAFVQVSKAPPRYVAFAQRNDVPDLLP